MIIKIPPFWNNLFASKCVYIFFLNIYAMQLAAKAMDWPATSKHNGMGITRTKHSKVSPAKNSSKSSLSWVTSVTY